MLSNGISLNLVSKYFGHTLISTTDASYGLLVLNALDELPAAFLRRA
jgi:site-specific recombinase XerD